MRIRIVRILLLAVAAEVLAILVLVILVVCFGPSDPDAASAYAERLGYWVGPIAGFVFCAVGGWLVARKLEANQVLNGFVLGATVAAIDVAILVAASAEFETIFVVSNIGRVLAGTLGGWLACGPGKLSASERETE